MTEIKISELSIGDWVRYDFPEIGTWNMQVTSIDEEDNHIGAGGVGASAWSDVSEFEPIRLTPEILEKNGFVRQDTESEIRYTLIEGNTMFGGTWAKSVFQWTFPMDFRFVHQLQHALRLAGVEKEIEL